MLGLDAKSNPEGLFKGLMTIVSPLPRLGDC